MQNGQSTCTLIFYCYLSCCHCSTRAPRNIGLAQLETSNFFQASPARGNGLKKAFQEAWAVTAPHQLVLEAGPRPGLCCWPGSSHRRGRRPPSQEPLGGSPEEPMGGSPEEPMPRGDGGSASNSQPDLEENLFPLSPTAVI